MRAQLFCCTPTEAALLEATDCLDGLAAQKRKLAPSRGSLSAARRAATAAAAAASSGDGDASAAAAAPAPAAPKPEPRSLLELWHEVACTFRRATELQALMGALNVG
jgi:hypothetical protein